MTYSEDLEATREENKTFRETLERIVDTCTNSPEDDAEIRDYCFYQADAALRGTRERRTQAWWASHGRQAAS